MLMLAPVCAGAQDLAAVPGSDPVQLSGSIGVSLFSYHSQGRPGAYSPTSWLLRGSPTLTIYGVVLPFSFTVTEQNREFRQPLNRLGVSPYYRWLTVHAGYRNLNWSPYSLGGHTFLGLGAEATPGHWHVGYIDGRFRRAIAPGDTAGGASVSPVFKRTGYAFRVGGGTTTRTADLIVLRGEDDEHSLPSTGLPGGLFPAENLVVSAGTRLGLTPRLQLDFELAQSAYTANKQTAKSGDFDKFLLKMFGSLMDRRESTVEAQAIETALAWKDHWGSMAVHYKRIDPGYRSMGAYFFNDDVDNITFEPTVKLMEERLRVAASLGFQHDNLKGTRDLQTDRTIGSVRVDFSPGSRYAINAVYSNYNMDQKAGRSQIDSSTTVVAQSANQIGVTQSLTLMGDRIGHSAILVWNRQDMNDKSTTTGVVDASYTSNMLTGSYVLTYIPLGLSGNVGYSLTRFELSDGDTRVRGPQFGASVSFLQNQGTIGVTEAISTTSIDGKDQIGTNTLQVTAAYRLQRRHRFSARFYVHDNSAKAPGVTSSTETKGEISYAYSL